MRKILFTLALIPSAASAAATYKIDIAYTAGDKLIRESHMVIQDKKAAEISEVGDDGVGAYLSVVPTRLPSSPKDQIRLDFKIGKIEDGQKIETWSPRLLALEGERASIEMGESTQKGSFAEKLRVSALVTRQP